MRREIGDDVFASDDPHEQAMPFPNMGNNPLSPILGSCRNWHQSGFPSGARQRSDEHTSELQSLMRISYAVFCLKKNTIQLHSLHHTTFSSSSTTITLPSIHHTPSY